MVLFEFLSWNDISYAQKSGGSQHTIYEYYYGKLDCLQSAFPREQVIKTLRTNISD